MKEYVKSASFGILIGSVITLVTLLFVAPIFYSVIIIQSACQGILARFIYTRQSLPYLVKMLIQMVGSWGLSMSCFFVLPRSSIHVTMVSFSINWFVIWLFIFTFWYFKNKIEAKTLTQLLKEIKNEDK